MSSVSKTSSTKVSIIRKSDYSRKNVDPVVEIEISNKESGLDNNTFSDLIVTSEKKDKAKKHNHLEHEQDKKDIKNEDGITDFYI